MFLNGKDTGYQDSPDWWWKGPNAFRIADLDEDYPEEYFPLAEPPKVKEFADTVISYFQKWSGNKLRTLLEFGSGGGWYLKEFENRNLAVHGYEGSPWGVAQCLKRGVGRTNIDLKDFRLPMERKFRMADLAIFTEVAEHVEISFHGTVVNNIVSQANAVWFSTETPDVPNKPHLHHPGEMPLQYWKNLFAFFGYECHMIPQEIKDACWGRAQCIFYNPKVYQV